jgi:DNA-binding SARP family transcriptional activator/TolB-like protein
VTVIRPNASLKLLGLFALTLNGEPVPSLPRRVQALLALLSAHKGRSLPRELAADMLWTDRGAQQARQSLRQALFTLRRALDIEIIRAADDSLSLVPEVLVVDVLEFETLASSQKIDDLARRASLYQGELLQNLPAISPRFDAWLGSERRRLEALATAGLHQLAEAQAAIGNWHAAIATARHLLEFDDMDEDAHRQVMRLLAKAGRRAEALRQYETCEQILKRELDVAPEPETIELARIIRNGRSEAAPLSRVSTVEPNDFPVAPEPQNSPRGRSKRWFHAASLVAACIMAAVVLFIVAIRGPVPAPNQPVLLITPFANNVTVDSQDLPVAGVSSLVAEELRETYSLRVAQYRADASDATPVREYVAATPVVRYILDGTATFSSSLDIVVHLNNRSGVSLWSDHYARPRGDVMDMVADIATHVFRAVAADSGVFGKDLVPDDHPKQTSRELLALSTLMRREPSGTSLAAFQQIIKKAVDLDPKNPEALALLSNGYLTHYAMTLQDSDLPEADRYLNSALALDQGNAAALWDKCFLRRMQRRYVESLELCRRVLDITAHHVGALREVGHDLTALHDPADAIPWFRAAIAASPNHPFVDNAYYGISEAELELGHVEAAIAAAQNAVQHDHWGSLVGLHLAAILETAGHDAEAKSALTQFYQHHPEFPPSNGLIPRMLAGSATRPPMLIDAFHQLGLDVAGAEQ